MEKYLPPHRRGAEFELLDELVLKLDEISRKKEIKTSIMLDHCDLCYDRKIGHLDESRLQYVPGYLHKKWFEPQSIQFVLKYGTRDQRVVNAPARMLSPYELRQLIVRSGVYESRVLSGYRFTPHEIEVNDASFKDARSEHTECSCRGVGYGHYQEFGDERAPSPSFWLPVELDKHIESDFNREWDSYKNTETHTDVETRFLSGNGIRTGYRKRSPEGRARRLEKRKSLRIRTCRPVPSPLARGTGLASVNPDVVLKLRFKYMPYGSRQNRNSRCDRYNPKIVENISRGDMLFSARNAQTKKDFYFLRKRNGFYHSVHSHRGVTVRKHTD